MELESGSAGPPGGHNPPRRAWRGAPWWVVLTHGPPSGGSWLQYLMWPELRRYFPKEEGMMHYISGRYFPQSWDQGYRTSRRTMEHHVNSSCTQRTNTCNPTCKRDCQSLLGKKIDKFVVGWINRSRERWNKINNKKVQQGVFVFLE